MTEVYGILYIAPAGTPLPEGVDAELDKAYDIAGYIDPGVTVYVTDYITYSAEHIRVFTSSEGYDYKAIADKPFTCVIDMENADGTISKRIEIPSAKLVSALLVGLDRTEVTIKMLRNYKGITHYIYYPKEAGNEQ